MRRTMQKLPKADSPAPNSRSKVTNGSALFVEADGRGPWPRRFKDLIAAHVADLGGVDGLSEAQKQLVRRAVTMEIELERMEGQLAEGSAVDLDSYGRNANSLRRILETLGLKRVAKDVTPNLADLIARHANKDKQ
jgi:hypothetical protein